MILKGCYMLHYHSFSNLSRFQSDAYEVIKKSFDPQYINPHSKYGYEVLFPSGYGAYFQFDIQSGTIFITPNIGGSPGGVTRIVSNMSEFAQELELIKATK